MGAFTKIKSYFWKLIESDTLCFIAEHNFYSLLLKEVLGSFVPHEIFCMNNRERVDEMVEQGFSEGGSYGAGFIFNKALNWGFNQLNPTFKETLYKNVDNFINNTPHHTNRKEVYELGMGLASYSFLIGSGLASSFFHNWVVSKLYKTQNFTDLVGVNGSALPVETNQQHLERLAKEKQQFIQGLKLLNMGILMGSTFLGLTHIALKKNWSVPSYFKKAFNFPFMNQSTSLLEQFSLKKGDFLNLPDVGIVLFSALPIYIGLIASARDKVESAEDWLRFSFYSIAMVVAPRLIENKINQFLKSQPLSSKAKKTIPFLAQVATGACIYSMPPIISNLALRKKRAEQFGLLRKQSAPEAKPLFVKSYYPEPTMCIF